MYKVFINNKCLIIRSPEQIDNQNSQNDVTSEIIEDYNGNALELYQYIKASDAELFIIESDQATFLFGQFVSSFAQINAAGALVKDQTKFLLIFRNNNWDLPKGKKEDGESFELTAIREVEEETNIKVELIKPLCYTYHMYEQENKIILKSTCWYQAAALNINKQEPQIEEGITELAWCNLTELIVRITNSYRSLMEVVECYQRLSNARL
ncbi:MAG TPA: NUDIX domain-containing protein [Bacteroidia bacterium]|nr:NUDIX domain-containing protein [Bacteroidia bacterium]HNT79485.1 NUDIX domain-containing protein [Bacteroidia bacterium]